MEKDKNLSPAEKAKKRAKQIGALDVGAREELKTPRSIMDKAIESKYPKMKPEVREHLAKAVVEAPKGTKLKIGKDVMTVDSLAVAIADSIEMINSETSSGEEYISWYAETRSIISDMNTNGVTTEELETRNDFLSHLNQREADIMTSLGLYARAMEGNPEVRAKYDALREKLTRLRQFRSAIKNTTNDKADNFEKEDRLKNNQEEKKQENQSVGYVKSDKESKQEAEKALLLATATVIALSNADRMSDAKKKELGIYHGNDFKDFDFYKHLKNQIDREAPAEVRMSLADEYIMGKQPKKLGEAQERIAAIREKRGVSQGLQKPIVTRRTSIEFSDVYRQRQAQMGR